MRKYFNLHKKVITYPSLRWKIQAFKDDKIQNMVIPWNSGNPVQFSVPSKTPRNPKRHTTGKIRTRWSERNHRFNPIKTSRFNIMDTKVSDLKKIEALTNWATHISSKDMIRYKNFKKGVILRTLNTLL